MSISDIETTMERIAFASEDSPIAVFRCNIPGRVNAMFANSIGVQERIRNKDQRLIGVYHAMMKRSHVVQELLNATFESKAETKSVDVPVFVGR